MSLVIGLTGPIGSGKNVLAELFEQKGWAVLDVDLIGKFVLEDSAIVAELSHLFGMDILGNTGNIVPSVLGEKVFSDNKSLKQLNALVHPKILSLVRQRVQEEKKNLLIHAALLFQVGLDTLCPLTISMAVHDHLIVERVMQRSSYLTEKMIQNILSEQKRYNDFWVRSDIIIDNNGTLKELEMKFERLYSYLKEG